MIFILLFVNDALHFLQNQKDAHRKMTQIGVIGSSRTLTGSRLATQTINQSILIKFFVEVFLHLWFA